MYFFNKKGNFFKDCIIPTRLINIANKFYIFNENNQNPHTL